MHLAALGANAGGVVAHQRLTRRMRAPSAWSLASMFS
jgi:hypothetical protein